MELGVDGRAKLNSLQGEVWRVIRAQVGVGKEGPSWELAGVVMLWPCDRAALVGEGANLYPAEVAEGEDVQGSGVRCMVEAGGLVWWNITMLRASLVELSKGSKGWALLEYSKNVEKDPWGGGGYGRGGGAPKALAIAWSWRGLDSLPTNFVNFNNFLRLPVEGFEKEISSLLKKLKSRKGCGGQGFKRKKEYSLDFLFQAGNS
ncbi:hypothetical protein CK203_041673 [Vitis vinifera]|uniref:Uncharacterized protein n=1 Tax=Vitis vinifera TaxID=29760 RepID=A0A438HD53_VITVI|nr:hypothetical protein CK203_041673 [Vitis vinifera]